jgi:hypothetical protein
VEHVIFVGCRDSCLVPPTFKDRQPCVTSNGRIFVTRGESEKRTYSLLVAQVMAEGRSHPIVDPSNYSALDPATKEIRVLEVAPGKPEDVIRCALKHVSLLDNLAPAYETISYCWGAPGEPAFIELNGEIVAVPASSEAAIRCMRYTDRPRIL